MEHPSGRETLTDLMAQHEEGKPFVYENNGKLFLHFDVGITQSCMNPDAPDSLVLDYTRAMMAGLLLNPTPARIMMVGLGGGSMVKYCYRYLPDAQIDVAEISEDVIALRDTFAIPRDDERLRIACCDGADFVAAAEPGIDLLFIDGFDMGGQAPSLCTQQFYDNCYAALSSRGVLIVNLSGIEIKRSAYVARIRRSFDDAVVIMRAIGCSNRIAFALKGDALRLTERQLGYRARDLEKTHPLDFQQLARSFAEAKRGVSNPSEA